jgi:L-amino acid N-acyltransferase YncA
MEFVIEPVSTEDGTAIVDIFNYYVESSFAAYPECKVPVEFFGFLMHMAEGYPFLAAKNGHGELLGFGLLRPHSPFPAFSRVAEITYFLAAKNTGKGIGRQMLNHLLIGAREKGIKSILASISSLNSASLSFHKKNGFQECGRFIGIGQKWGQDFDVVWMQRMV